MRLGIFTIISFHWCDDIKENMDECITETHKNDKAN